MTDREHLQKMVAVVEQELAQINAACGTQPTSSDWDQHRAWWNKRHQEIDTSKGRLELVGARFTSRPPDAHTICLAGVRSSSTMGWMGAFHNWLTAARKRLEKEAP